MKKIFKNIILIQKEYDDMESAIHSFIINTMNIKDKKLIAYLESICSCCHLKQKSILFNKNQKPDYIVFLLNGIARGYTVTDKGIDITECFEYQFGAPLVPSLPLDAPAEIFMETVTECDIIQFPISDVVELIRTNVAISQMYNDLLIQSMHRHLQLTKIVNQYSAEQRYKWFLSEYSDLVEKVSNKYIASFLNMSTVTLSRVRGKMGIANRHR